MTDSTRAIVKQYKPATIQRFTGDCDNCDMSAVVYELQPWRKMTSTRDASTTPEERGSKLPMMVSLLKVSHH